MKRNAILTFLCALLMLAATPASAQHLMLKAGGGLAKQFGDSKPVGAFKIGLGYEYEFDQHWTLTPSLLFYGKGWKAPDVQVQVIDDETLEPAIDENGNPLMSTKSVSSSANYVELPVILSYYFRTGEDRYIVLGAGPYAAVGVAGKTKTKGDGQRIGSEKLFYKENTFENGALRFDAGIQAYGGYQFPSGLIVGIEADFGMVKFRADGQRNLAALVSLTYRFD